MNPKKRLADFSDVRLYVVTSPPRPGQSYATLVESACAGGADAVQLRDKSLSARALFILNDRVDVAAAAGVDGVHVGQEDLPVRAVREMVGHRKIIGCSTHSIAQALAAAGDGADYISCGPVFPTPTKPDAPAVGLELVREYKKLVRLPFVAIGGIDAGNAGRVIQEGADRVAVVRAVCGAADVEAAARAVRESIEKAEGARIARKGL